MIPNIGPMEIAIVVILLLIIFGPKKLPDLGRSAGKSLQEFRTGLTSKHEADDEEALPKGESTETEATRSRTEVA
jgi:sec-independent protein translocase protein TatA